MKKNKDYHDIFPLTPQNKLNIESKIYKLKEKQYGKDTSLALKNYSRNYSSTISTFNNITFESFGWEQKEASSRIQYYMGDHSDHLRVFLKDITGKIVTGDEFLQGYRDWLRNSPAALSKGGLILCEKFKITERLQGIEGILMLPRKSTNFEAIDYSYFIDSFDTKNENSYSIVVKIFEMKPYASRKDLFIKAFLDEFNLDIEEISDWYFKDPYDPTYKLNTLMGIHEREEFDYLFPTHPLSILRQEIRPMLKNSLTFIN